MILASGSVPTGHSVQSVFQHRAVPLPLDGKPRDQRLGHVARPPAAELHGVLLSDYNIIRPGRASHEAREIGLRVGVMILIRLELHDSAETAQLRCERLRIGDPSSRQDAAPGEHRQLMARSRLHPLELAHGEVSDTHEGAGPSLLQPARESVRRRGRRALPGHHDNVGAGQRVPSLPPRPSWQDRKSTRLNSSHLVISYAVFCLKKKKYYQTAI